MALQINTKKCCKYECWEIVKNGIPDIIEKQIEYPACYVMINHVNGNKEMVKLNVLFYADSTKEQIVQNKYYTFAPSVADNSTNFIQQGYEYLKTLPEFADAVDC